MPNKKHLILLHGALGSRKQFEPLANNLFSEYTIHRFDLPAHGSLAFQRDIISMYSFVNYVRNYILKNEIVKPFVFGFSMGGYIALTLQSQTNIFSKIMTLNTKLEWSTEIAKKEQKMFDPNLIIEKVPKYAEYLKSIHGEKNWKNLLEKHRKMMFDIADSNPLSDYALTQIIIPILLTRGEKDKMVTSEETKSIASKFSKGSYLEFENSEHPIEKMDIELLSSRMKDFLT